MRNTAKCLTKSSGVFRRSPCHTAFTAPPLSSLKPSLVSPKSSGQSPFHDCFPPFTASVLVPGGTQMIQGCASPQPLKVRQWKDYEHFMLYFLPCDRDYKTHASWVQSFLWPACPMGIKQCEKLHIITPGQGSHQEFQPYLPMRIQRFREVSCLVQITELSEGRAWP